MTRVRVLLGGGRAGPPATAASATTVTYEGTRVVVTGGDSANHDIQLRYNSGTNADEIIDTQDIGTIPGDCTRISNLTWVSCPSHGDVRVDLGGGNDQVTFGGSTPDCFDDLVVNLGDGTNTVNVSDQCPTSSPETVTVTSGSGQDTLTGGNQTTSTFSAGGGDDNVYASSGTNVIHGGEGNDRLFGGSFNDQVLGEGGNDDVDGKAGNDLIDGGPDDDRLEYSTGLGGNDTGAGSDTYVGGSGSDHLYLDKHAGGVSITIDGAANDGAPGEGDNVGADIEAIDGTTSNDVFTGSPGPDNFAGGSGNDEIHGAGGNDDLYGSSGDDKVYGDAGNDKVQGATGADTVDGGPGTDQLYGDIAGCSVFCSFDSDTLFARDGEQDAVDCGGGADTAQVDASDVVAFCAAVDRAPAGGAPPPPKDAGGGGGGGKTTGAAAKATLATTGPLKIGGALHVTLTCPAACRYKIAIVVSAQTARRFRLGRVASTIALTAGSLKAPGGKRATTLRLTAKARQRLRKARTVKGTLRLTVTNPAGKVTVTSRPITLRG
jgi:Ca2+-binding RTX toxin-like protein